MMRDYRCKKCGEVIEVYAARPAGDFVIVCPKCRVKMEKLPSAPNFKVKDGTPIFYGDKS